MSESNATKGSTQQSGKRPRTKFGRVAVWTNTIQTVDGDREILSFTISPRRYRDPTTGEWRDAMSYRASDLPALEFDLQKAIEYRYENPLVAQDLESDGNAEVPF